MFLENIAVALENFDWSLDFHDVEINVFMINYNNYIGVCASYYKFSWIVIRTCHIAEKFGGKKVWQIYSSKDLVKESLANGIVN